MVRHPDTMNSSRQRQPGFFWQGLLIVLPVVVLAGAAVWSLRQDRILARHEAAERARDLAEETASALWSKLTAKESLDQFNDHTFRVDASGRLLYPPPAPPLPSPSSLDLTALNEAQRASWSVFGRETAGVARTNAVAATRHFLDLAPPEAFAAISQFRLAHLLAAQGQPVEAALAFSSVASRFPDAHSESGLPLGPLAELKALELTAGSNGSNAITALALNSFCSNVVNRPSFLSAHLLAKATELQASRGLRDVVEPWRREWERHESLRSLAGAALKAWAKTPPLKPGEDRSTMAKPTSLIPVLSWFEALDESPNPQPLFLQGTIDYNTKEFAGVRPHNLVTKFEASNGIYPASLSAPRESRESRWVGLPGVGMPQHTPREWLATRIDDENGGYAIVCRVMGYITGDLKSSIGSPAWLELRGSLPKFPPWLGATIELAGVPLLTTSDLQVVVHETVSKGSGQQWRTITPGYSQEILATAHRLENGNERLRVNIHLVSRDLLFGRQRTRTYLFGLLIAASSTAALFGFVSARRAFVRQQQLSDMKSNFVSSVSHELRAPIASVRLLAESLERGRIAEPAKQNEYFRFIVQECRRLSSLIENVLDFARIEQGRKQYEFEPTDVLALVGKTVKLLEPVAAEKQVTLQLQLPEPGDGPHPETILDASAIQQALVNLLDNAVKHAPARSEVTIGLNLNSQNGDPPPGTCEPPGTSTASPSPGAAGEASGNDKPPGRGEGGPTSTSRRPPSMLRLWVQDHGRGIPPEEHQRIFERFYRPGSEMRRETQGVGIGLSIVKHIVEAHRGRVYVESELGKGSRFTIELPLEDRNPKSETRRKSE